LGELATIPENLQAGRRHGNPNPDLKKVNPPFISPPS
jgi:hypothetical protein